MAGPENNPALQLPTTEIEAPAVQGRTGEASPSPSEGEQEKVRREAERAKEQAEAEAYFEARHKNRERLTRITTRELLQEFLALMGEWKKICRVPIAGNESAITKRQTLKSQLMMVARELSNRALSCGYSDEPFDQIAYGDFSSAMDSARTIALDWQKKEEKACAKESESTATSLVPSQAPVQSVTPIVAEAQDQGHRADSVNHVEASAGQHQGSGSTTALNQGVKTRMIGKIEIAVDCTFLWWKGERTFLERASQRGIVQALAEKAEKNEGGMTREQLKKATGSGAGNFKVGNVMRGISRWTEFIMCKNGLYYLNINED